MHHDLLGDYGPEAWGDSVAQLVSAVGSSAVIACGTDRGNDNACGNDNARRGSDARTGAREKGCTSAGSTA